MSAVLSAPAATCFGDASQARSSTAAVLLHGLCSSPDELLGVASALRTAGFAVHSLQIDGYSFDAAATRQRASRCEDWLAEIEATLARLRQTHQRVVLIGISAGATLALAAALRRPQQVDALVLMSITLLTDGWAVPRHQFLLPLALYTPLGRLWRYTERAPFGVKDERVRQWVERQLRARRLSSAGAAVLEVGHLRENHRLTRQVKRAVKGTLKPVDKGLGKSIGKSAGKAIGKVAGQAAGAGRFGPAVLLLHALEDEVASPANVAWLAQHLHCDSLRSVLFEDCYHMISIDKQRKRVAAETVAFASDVAARGQARISA